MTMYLIHRKYLLSCLLHNLFALLMIVCVSAEDNDHYPHMTVNGTIGGTAYINCTVAQENGNIGWYFNGHELTINDSISQTNETISVNDIDGNKIKHMKYILTIQNATVDHAGLYTCQTDKNKVEKFLKMEFKGKLLSKNDTVERDFSDKINNFVKLECEFEVYNSTEVLWTKDNEILQNETADRIDARRIKSSYQFNISNPDDYSGSYLCKVWDPVANNYIKGETNVIVYAKPRINLEQIIPINDTQLFLKWTVKAYNANISSYVLKHSILPDGDTFYYPKTIPVNSTSFIMEKLQKSTNYSITLIVTTEYLGKNDSGEATGINRTLDTPPVFVPNISIKGFSAKSVTIGWESPPKEIVHLIHYYELQARKKKETTWRTAYHLRDDRNLPYMFEHLEPYNTYVFRVHACSEYTKKCGPWSEEMEAATLDGIPEKPHSVEIYCDVKDMNLTWNPPLKPNAEIKGYSVELIGRSLNYMDRDGVLRNETWGPLSKFMPDKPNFVQFKLQPNTEYLVKLSALTRTRKRGEEEVKNCTTPFAPPDTPPRPSWTKIVEDDRYLFKVSMPRVSERNGPICCYRVYMMRLPKQLNWNNMPDPGDVDVISYSEAHERSRIGAYLTDLFTNKEFPSESELIMGDDKIIRFDTHLRNNTDCSRCLMQPNRKTKAVLQLPPETTTSVSSNSDIVFEDELEDSRRKREVASPEEENIELIDGPLDETHNYTLFVELIPGKPEDAPLYSEYLNVLMPAPSVIPARPPTALEIALQVTCAIAAAVLLGMIIFCIMHTRKSRKAPHGHLELWRIICDKVAGRTALVPTTPPDLPPIAKEDLPEAYAERQVNSDYGFQQEFEMLPEYFVDRTTHASEARENQAKNRYPDIKAYDQTRVKLTQIDSVMGSDYINANYVMGYQDPTEPNQERKQFICAQGPTETTVNDFWRMIWEHGLELIVMLTNLEEYSKVKCSKYWPDEVRGTKAFGNVTVHHISEKRYSEYIVRELRITKQATTAEGQLIVENNGVAKRNGDLKEAEEGSVPTSPREKEAGESRIVKQYHFLVWKDFVAPEYPQSILKFIKRVNEARMDLMGRPVVVHCSAGVGRTGTLVALDWLLEELRSTGQVTVFNTIAELRRQRNYLVQSLKQYVFVYRALVEYAYYGDTEIPASKLKSSIDRLRNTPEDGKSLMELEFEKLLNCPIAEPIKSTAAGSAEEVRVKNRNNECLPYDRNRVILTPIPGREFSTYINASFIEAYDNSEGFIVTQDPLPNTIADFWRMVSEHNVATIVMLSELGDGKCPRYWDDGTAQYEHISVQYEESESCPYYTRRQFRVTNNKSGEVQSVRQLQYHGWPTAPGHVPEVTRGLAELADAAAPHTQHQQRRRPAMLLHCQYGTERSALFVALCTLITQLRLEKKVDVSGVARKVRSQRHNTIDTLLQYEFLYRAILNYAELHNLLDDS